MDQGQRLKIAVIGTGISGLSAAWLLTGRHDVTVYERADRLGGHSNTVLVRAGRDEVAVDTGFIVFNRQAYPNLTALFAHFGVPTQDSEMSFAASLDGGALEYSGSALGLFAQPRNLVRRRFWSMLADIVRFYRVAPAAVAGGLSEDLSLGTLLEQGGYGRAFRDDHLLPMASAIWSASPADILSYPAASFIRFHENHGLLKLRHRPVWQTVTGGSRRYVARFAAALAGRVRLHSGVRSIWRTGTNVVVTDSNGQSETFDHVLLATHADQSLAMLADPTESEGRLLSAFRYSRNLAVLHQDPGFMPRRRAVWSSWNYIGARDSDPTAVCVTYWMNRLQSLSTARPLFVTLNPPRPPRAGTLLHSEVYEHPLFDAKAIAAQRQLWQLQGRLNTWYCGAWFGAGFHEDGLQSGLAAAEQLGGVRRPWQVQNESGRIHVSERASALASAAGLPA